MLTPTKERQGSRRVMSRVLEQKTAKDINLHNESQRRELLMRDKVRDQFAVNYLCIGL